MVLPGIDDGAFILKRLLDDYAKGKLAYNRIIYDGIVQDIDTEGRQFTEDNPQDSIRVRIITDLADRFYKDDLLGVAWPLLGIHTRPPLKIGERVKIIYEHPSSLHMWWLPVRHFDDDINFKPWSATTDPGDESSNEAFGEGNQEDDSVNLDDIAMLKDGYSVGEDPHVSGQEVPIFNKSHDEHVLEGSDNSMLRLGRDRHGEIGSGHDAGCADIIVGRDGEDPSWDDPARDYTSAVSNIDENLKNPTDIDEKEVSAKAISADVVRIRARKNLIIYLDDGVYISINEGKIEIGGTGSEKTGGVITSSCVSRHECPFLKWVLPTMATGGPGVIIPPATDPILITPSPAAFVPTPPTSIVESAFNAAGTGSPDGTEEVEELVVKD